LNVYSTRLKQNIYITMLRDCSEIQIHKMKVYIAILILFIAFLYEIAVTH
jgi:hypothetical protein